MSETRKEVCYKLTENGSEEVSELRCTQEEADTRVLLNARQAASNGYKVNCIG